MAAWADRYPEWKAPSDDGQSLIWPEPAKVLAETGENQARLAKEPSEIQNVPLSEVRGRQRAWLGMGKVGEGPIVATGHQTELYHPGVWVKDVMIDLAARKLGGTAVHFAVDTDEPKHLAVKWPGESRPLTDDPAEKTASWSGLVAGPTPGHVMELERAVEGAKRGRSFDPMLGKFLGSMKRLAMEGANISAAVTNAMHELDWGLGLRHHAMLASPIWGCEPYLLFVHHVMARAEKFAADYNAALAEYRKAKQIRTPGRPMPDLKVEEDRIESPFWIDNLANGTRVRASVERRGEDRTLISGSDEFALDERLDGWEAADRLQKWLRKHNLRISPRALTLTTFLRLCVVDQFVHGIGGGRYDQVTDRLIEKHFGIEAPKFSVTTATLYFPEALGRERVCVRCIVEEGHRLRHNVLGSEKMELVSAIAAAPRGSIERSRTFQAMHDKLRAAAGDERIARWTKELEQAEARDRQDAMVFDRELFYAVQPEARLRELMGEYEKAL